MKTPSETTSSWPLARIWAGIVLTAAIAAILLVAVAGWLTHGTTILFTLAQDGLAWCF